MSNCKDEEERIKTAELIRPILRGRDIKRYDYNWAGLYLIATFPSQHYNIELYPAVKQYLLSFSMEKLEQTGKTYIINGEIIKSRKKTRNKWFELQDSISYWEDFLKPKICWKAIGRNLAFAIVDSDIYLTAPASYISAGNKNNLILDYLCSSIGKYFIYKNSDTTGAGDIMLNIQSLIKFPIPKNIKITSKNKKEIDKQIFKSYLFNNEEINYIYTQIQ